MSYPVLILPWLLPLLPYAAVECQTVACRSILLPATRAGLREIGFSDRVIFFRVMLLTPGAAKVYVVTPCMPHGARPTRYRAVVLRLIREARTWCSAQSETDVWSDCGSANGNVFPPYWGKGDYN